MQKRAGNEQPVMQNFAETKELVLRYCIKCIEMEQKFCEVCAHFFAQSWYYNNRKNPPIHYILFLLYPIVKIPSPKRAASDGCSFFVMEKSSSEEREIDRSIELR